jgi:hypothetical protein
MSCLRQRYPFSLRQQDDDALLAFNPLNQCQIKGNIMGKYLVRWEADPMKILVDPKG